MDLQPCGRFDWERILRRCLIPGPVKLVGFTLAQYGDIRGEGIRPGIPRLTRTCGMSDKTIRRHIDLLRSLGLVEKLTHGGGRTARAALWRLTLPPDLPARVEMLDPDEDGPMSYSGHFMTAVEHVDSLVDEGSTPVTVETGVTNRYSGHSDPLLRSFDLSTAVTQVTAYQETKESIPRNRAPQVSTSPGAVITLAPDPDPPDAETERRRQAAALDAWTATHPTATPEAS